MHNCKRTLIKLLSSFFFLGYFPYLSGTLASLVSLLIIWNIRNFPLLYFLITILTTLLGFILTDDAELIFGKKDSKKIVIDEVAGMFFSFLFVPLKLNSLFLGFILFRIFDGLKVYPADLVERFSSSSGVMLDDLISGLYTNLVLQLVFRLLV